MDYFQFQISVMYLAGWEKDIQEDSFSSCTQNTRAQVRGPSYPNTPTTTFIHALAQIKEKTKNRKREREKKKRKEKRQPNNYVISFLLRKYYNKRKIFM